MTRRNGIDRAADEQLDREERQRIAGELGDASARDYVVALGSAAVAYLPVAGPLLSSVITEAIPRRQQQRMIEFVRLLNSALGRLESRIDQEFVKSDEFADTLEQFLQSAGRARNMENRRFFAAALARSATNERPDQSERALLLDTLDAVRPLHLSVLAAVVTDPQPPDRASEYFHVSTSAHAYLRQAVPDVPQDVSLRAWEDLARLGLLDSPRNVVVTEDSLEPPTGIILPLGRRFMEFILPLDE